MLAKTEKGVYNVAKTIVIANQKGGVGKTTTAIEIAAALSLQKKRVLLIDLDQQGNLSRYVGADNRKASIYDALHGKVKIQNAIQRTEICDVITSSPELSKADREFVDADDVFLLADLIDFVKEEYDYIVLDNNPSRNVLLTMAYVAGQYVIVPSECDAGSLDGIAAINRDIVKLRDGRMSFSKARIIGLVLTKTERTVMHSVAGEELERIAELVGGDPFILNVKKSIVVSECKKVCQSLQQYAKWSAPAMDYRKIAEEIVRRTST